ncbi:hypothetical protein VNO77_03736 [Canavalia gladiata]|uniref:Uncharacterized protein n=1 Tax=Canavalia gladiata TaxID=3824 RepID=A0AAN9N0D2_CANGL
MSGSQFLKHSTYLKTTIRNPKTGQMPQFIMQKLHLLMLLARRCEFCASQSLGFRFAANWAKAGLVSGPSLICYFANTLLNGDLSVDLAMTSLASFSWTRPELSSLGPGTGDWDLCHSLSEPVSFLHFMQSIEQEQSQLFFLSTLSSSGWFVSCDAKGDRTYDLKTTRTGCYGSGWRPIAVLYPVSYKPL